MTTTEKRAREIWETYSFEEKYQKAKKYAERNDYDYPEECTEEVINTYFPTAWDLYRLGVDLKDFVNCEYVTPDNGQGYGTYTQSECEVWCDEMFEEQLRTDDPEDIFGLDWDFEEDEEEEEDEDEY